MLSDRCGICYSKKIDHNGILGINVCLRCGAHQVENGWQARDLKNLPAKQQYVEMLKKLYLKK